MIKRALFSTLAILAISGITAFADDKADMQSALDKLAGAPNYSWSASVENAGGFGGGGGGGAAPAPTTGMAEKDGYTVVTAPPGGGRGGRRGGGGGGGFGGGAGGPPGGGGAPGAAPGGAPRGAGAPPAATPITIVMKGSKAVAKVGDEWKTTEELQAAAAAGAGGPPGGGAPGGAGPGGAPGGGFGGGGGRGGFGGGGPDQQALLAIQNVSIPTTMIKDATAKVDNVKKTADGFSADLGADTVKSMMAFGRGGRGGAAGGAGGFTPPELTNPKGTINVTLANGVPSKIVIHTTGSMDFGGNAIDMDRTTTVSIKDVGSTKVDVPADAKKKLDAAK